MKDWQALVSVVSLSILALPIALPGCGTLPKSSTPSSGEYSFTGVINGSCGTNCLSLTIGDKEWLVKGKREPGFIKGKLRVEQGQMTLLSTTLTAQPDRPSPPSYSLTPLGLEGKGGRYVGISKGEMDGGTAFSSDRGKVIVNAMLPQGTEWELVLNPEGDIISNRLLRAKRVCVEAATIDKTSNSVKVGDREVYSPSTGSSGYYQLEQCHLGAMR